MKAVLRFLAAFGNSFPLQVLLFLSIYPYALSAQKKQGVRRKQIFIGTNFSPDYSFRTLTNTDGSSSSGAVINNRNSIERAKFGFTSGIGVSIEVSQSLAFETGLQISNKGYKTKSLDLVFAQPDPALPIRASFMYSYQYVGIPLKGTFTLGKNRLRFLPGMGIMTNILVHQKVTSQQEYPGGKTDIKSQSSTADYKKVDISPMISLGIKYRINSKTYITAEPTFRYGLIKTRDAAIAEHLWSAGFNCGVYYRVR